MTKTKKIIKAKSKNDPISPKEEEGEIDKITKRRKL